jgi:hypothetical protein
VLKLWVVISQVAASHPPLLVRDVGIAVVQLRKALGLGSMKSRGAGGLRPASQASER